MILVSFLFFGVAWAGLTCDCGRRNAGRIVGGTETKKNEYPWMIAIRTRTNSFTFCGGAILTPWHIITAAHCVWTRQAKDLVAIIGAHDVNDLLDKTRKLHNIDQAIVHPA
ncbi:trypsin-like serine protease, partial [Shewanella sp. C32]